MSPDAILGTSIKTVEGDNEFDVDGNVLRGGGGKIEKKVEVKKIQKVLPNVTQKDVKEAVVEVK